jgi:hypothetical protein
MPTRIKASSRGGSAQPLQALIADFVGRIVATVEAATAQRIQSAVAGAFNGASIFPRRRGRPPKNPLLSAFAAPAATRRPKQLCPVPGCTNPAAPAFGMVCAKHKDLPKAKIKKYRAARRAAKNKK